MRQSSRTVFIPIVDDSGEDGCVACIKADSFRPTRHPAGLNDQVTDLDDWELYETGYNAIIALKGLAVKPRALALAQRFGLGSVSTSLSVENVSELHGLSSDKTSSAALGLALALAMHAGQSRDRYVIATGCLDYDATPTIAPKDDVKILPVGQLDGKFAVLARWIETWNDGPLAPRLIFFVPQFSDGGATDEVLVTAIQDLKARFLRRGVTLDVHPVASLREALGVLGITAFAARLVDRLLVGALAASVVFSVIAAFAYRFLTAPLDLAFGQVSLSNGASVVTPVPAKFDAQRGDFQMRAPCINAERLPVYKAGEALVFRAELREPRSIASSYIGYRFAVLAISETSGVKVFPPETFGRPPDNLAASDVHGWNISVVLPIRGPTEESKLIILVRKLRSFDTNKLRGDLNAVIEPVEPGRRINAGVTYLSGYAPGYLDYSFVAADEEIECVSK